MSGRHSRRSTARTAHLELPQGHSRPALIGKTCVRPWRTGEAEIRRTLRRHAAFLSFASIDEGASDMRAIAALVLLMASMAGLSYSAVAASIAAAPTMTEEQPAQPAAAVALQRRDADIRQGLTELYAEIEGLEDVSVEVRGGVVTLGGTTLEVTARSQAEDIAARLDGVASVENQIQTEHRLDRRLAPLMEQTEAIGARVVAVLPLLLVALLVLAGFWVAGVLFTRWTNIFRRMVSNPFVESLLEQVVRGV